MKLYDGGRAPNPRRVRIFLAEKGIEIEKQQVDLGTLEHKGAAYTAINPLQRVPALVLDDGTILTESIAICATSRRCNRSRHCLGAPGARRRSSRCGTGGLSIISCSASPRCFGIFTRR